VRATKKKCISKIYRKLYRW